MLDEGWVGCKGFIIICIAVAKFVGEDNRSVIKERKNTGLSSDTCCNFCRCCSSLFVNKSDRALFDLRIHKS